MGVLWFLFVILATGNALKLTDEQYHQMPQLFQLDDYGMCLSQKRGAFCLGSFDLVASSNNRLFNVLQKFSEDPSNFNHTRIHRGFCVSSRCSHIDEVSLNRKFAKCVSKITKEDYGLDTKLSSLEYCKASKTPPSKPVDDLDIAFAYLCGIIVLMNAVGTIYDLMRNPDHKPNRYLIAWSFFENLKRLTNSYENGDARLLALGPIHGIKTILLILVMLAHSVLTYHYGYLHNPQFLEHASRHPLSMLLHNGSVIVQAFIMLSSFLLAYNLLIYIENNPKKELNLSLFPNIILNRLSRITPLYIFVVGFVATWWRHTSDGPMWAPLITRECVHCRNNWWMQFLYINNFVNPDVRCLMHTWFLTVDMQLYILATFLTLTLGRSLCRAIKIFCCLFVCSIVANFLIAYNWNLKAILFLTYPEYMRYQYIGDPSFKWFYAAPWASLPSSLLGLVSGFLLYYWQQVNFKPEESLTLRILHRCSVPSMFIWILSGYLIRNTSSTVGIAAYTAIDRPVFCLMIVPAMFGFIYKIDSGLFKLLSWNGWRVLSRMSLPILLVHWCYNLTQEAEKTNLSRSSVYEIGGHFLMTTSFTYLTSFPLHLLVELPVYMSLKAVIL